MKIAQINSVFNQGSTGRIVSDIHNLLIEKGHQSKVFYGRGPISEDTNVVKFSNDIAVYKDVLWTRAFNRHSESDHNNTQKLITMLKEFSPDIIQIHNIHGYYLNYKILFDYFKDSNIPIVWLLHDQWPISGNAAYFDETKVDWEKLEKQQVKVLSKDYPNHWFPNISNSERVFQRKKNIFNIENLTIITPSNWLANVVKNSFLKSNKVKVINNGIDLSKFAYHSNINEKKEKQLLGVASVWDKRKGLNYFNRLAEELGETVNITLVGVTKEQEKHLSNKINFIRKTESVDELAKIYSYTDILVNPTLQDNFPTVNIEAQACGTPVITFNTGGSPESVVVGKTGEVAEKGNFEEMKKLILNWPKKNMDIVSECILNSKKYSKNDSIYHYLELYTEIIKS